MVKQKCCLVVIDGWGISTETDPKGDAVRNASTPVMDSLAKKYPNTPLEAHGIAVGLPDGLMGNSEVGHLNIGAGRVVYQDIVRIELSIKKDTLRDLPAVQAAFTKALDTGRLHLLGLVSDGGVHAHLDHLKYLVNAAKNAGIKKTFVHFFGDGRDTAPKSALGYMTDLLDYFKSISYGEIATVIGRYYAMDRDKRWERVKIAYDGIVQGKGTETNDVLKTMQEKYDWCNSRSLLAVMERKTFTEFIFATGANISTKWSPWIWVNPFATKRHLYRSIDPSDFNLISNTNFESINFESFGI